MNGREAGRGRGVRPPPRAPYSLPSAAAFLARDR